MGPPDDYDELREIRVTVLNAVLMQLKLVARLKTERYVNELGELSGQDMAPVRAQLDQIFGIHSLPALPPISEPLSVAAPRLSDAVAPKRRGRPPKTRPDHDGHGHEPDVG